MGVLVQAVSSDEVADEMSKAEKFSSEPMSSSSNVSHMDDVYDYGEEEEEMASEGDEMTAEGGMLMTVEMPTSEAQAVEADAEANTSPPTGAWIAGAAVGAA